MPPPEPTEKRNSDFYVNTGNGASSWTGLSNVSVNDRLIWNDNTNVWDIVPPPVADVDLNYVTSPGQGTVETGPQCSHHGSRCDKRRPMIRTSTQS